jgi:murein L,D-transpeptidase YafK
MRSFASDPNLAFWTNLREGYDIFEATKRELRVDACGGRYVFNARARSGAPLSPLAPCPELVHDLPDDLVERIRKKSEALHAAGRGASGQSPNARFVDGSMHYRFRAMLREIGPEEMSRRTSLTGVPVSRPESLASVP